MAQVALTPFAQKSRFAPRTPSQPIRGIAYGVLLSLVVWMMIALAIWAL